MRPKIVIKVLIAALSMAGFSTAKDSPDEKREKTRKMAAQTLKDLYKLQPASKQAIEKSAGYAIFSNMGANVLLLSTARGSRIAVNSKTRKETFMKMVSAGAGPGLGVKDYRVVFVFENGKVLEDFLNSGWGGTAQADAAAKTEKSGGAYSGARSCIGCLGIPNYKERSRTPGDVAGNKVTTRTTISIRLSFSNDAHACLCSQSDRSFGVQGCGVVVPFGQLKRSLEHLPDVLTG